MPRRKSATQGALTKRHIDDKAEPSDQTPAKKIPKGPDDAEETRSNYMKLVNATSAATTDTRRTDTIRTRWSTKSQEPEVCMPVQVSTLPSSTPTNIIINPLTVTTSEGEGDDGTSVSPSKGEKRNLSLELLCQVGSSELQNITRQSPDSPSPYIIIDSNQKVGGDGTQQMSAMGRHFVHIVSDNNSQLLCIQNSGDVTEKGDTEGPHYASVLEISAEEFARLKNESKLIEDKRQNVKTEVASVSDQGKSEIQSVEKKRRVSKPGRHICPYCGRACAKPSVLQKHLRAHTGERPYPCTSCGFAFKTKSNLYKHCKSRAHALKAIVTEGNAGSASSPIKLHDDASDEEITDEAEESVDEDANSLHSNEMTDEKLIENTEGNDNVIPLKVERTKSFEGREQAPIHVLQSVAKYLEKPKEERPKVEIQQKKPESQRPRIATKLKKLKLDLEGENRTVLKLIRSSSVQESKSQSTSSLRRAVSVIDQHNTVTPIQLRYSVLDHESQSNQPKASGSKTGTGAYLTKTEDVRIVTDKDTTNSDIISLMSNSDDQKFVSVISNKGEDKQFVPITLVKTSSPAGGVIYTAAKMLPKIAPKKEFKETIISSDVGASVGNARIASSEGSTEQYVMHKTSSGGSVSVRPLSLEVLQTGDATRENSKRPILVKQDAIDIKSGVSEKSIDVATPSSETEIIYLPNANADPTKSLKALRQLENLSEKYKKETIAGYQLLPSIMSFPDGSCQVTLQYIPKSGESDHSQDSVGESGKNITSAAQLHCIAKELSESSKVDRETSQRASGKSKSMDSEILKQRIQDLISRNARIVKTPMAEPPRYKRPTSRQSSEVEMPQSPSIIQVQNKPNVSISATTVSTPTIHTISLSNFLSSLSSSQVKLPTGELHGIKSLIDSEKQGDVKHTSEAAIIKSPGTAFSQTVLSKPPSAVSELVRRLSHGKEQKVMTLGTSGSVTHMPKDKATISKDTASKDLKTVITKDESTKEIKINFQIAQNPEDGVEAKGMVKDKIKEKLRASMIDSNKTYSCNWCDALFSENQVLELHKEYYCRGKHGMAENPSSIISTDKIVKLFSDAGKKTGGKEMVKSYSLGQNFKVVRNVEEQGNQKPRIVSQTSVSNSGSVTPTVPYKNVQLFRSTSVPAHSGIDVSLKNKPRFQKVAVLPGTVDDKKLYTVVQSQVLGSTRLTLDGGQQTDRAVKKEPVRYKSLLNPVDSKPVVRTNLSHTLTLDMLNEKLGNAGPVLLKVNKPKTVEEQSPTGNQKDSMVVLSDKYLQSIQVKPVPPKPPSEIKQKALEKLITEKVETQAQNDPAEPPAWKKKLKDKLLRKSLSMEKIPESPSDAGKASPKVTSDNRKRKFSEERFLSNLIVEVRKNKISRYDSAPVLPSQEKVVPEVIKTKRIKKKTSSEIFVPVVTAQAVYNFAQINSYRMFQDDICADGVPRSHKGHAGVEGFWISPAGKYRISKLKAALLGMDSIGNLSEQERLKMIKEWEKEANKAREESESKDIKSKLAKMLHLHKYPSLGWSTNTSFCCLSRPQPMYVPLGNHKKMSMYSNWRTSPLSSNPAGMTTAMLLSQYCSVDRDFPTYKVSGKSSASEGILTHSTYWTFSGKKNVLENKSLDVPETPTSPKTRAKEDALKLVKGGHMSFDSYTYVRGRGRGKYVCNECGVRCKKPSMLKKHIRSHTNLRPFKCNHCILSFKTKGNLTKHMNTKSHYRTCTNLGLSPVPTQVDKSQIDPVALSAQFELSKQARIVLKDGEMMPFDLTNVEDDSDGDDKDEAEDDGNDLDASKDSSETMSATEGPSFDESDMDTEVEHSAEVKEEVIPHIPTSCSTSIGSGLIGPVPVICSTIQTHPVTVSKETTVSQSAGASETNSETSNILNDSTSLGTVYGFENTHIKVIDSEVTKSLPPLSSEDIDDSTSSREVTRSPVLDPSGGTGNNKEEIILIPDDMEQQDVCQSEPCDSEVKQPLAEDEEMDTSNMRETNDTDSLPISADIKPKTLPILSDISFTVPLGGYMPPMVPALRIGGNNSSNFGPIVGQLIRQPPITLQLSGLPPMTPTSQSTPVHLPFQFQHPFFDNDNMEVNGSDITEDKSKEVDKEEDVVVENEIKVNLIKISDVPGVSQQLGQQDACSSETNPKIMHVLINNSSDNVSVQSTSNVQQSTHGADGENTVHSIEDSGNYKCDLCGKSFTEQQHLILHRKIHVMEPAYGCSLCGKKFTSIQQCMIHCQEHKKHPNQPIATKDNPRPFRCLECDTGFRTKFHLSRHFKSRLHIYKLEELKMIPQGTYSFIEEILPSLDSFSSEGFRKLLMENLSTRNIIDKLLESEKLVSEMKKRRSSQASVLVDEAKDTNEVLILQESRDDVPATFTVVALDDQNKTSKESTEAKNEDTEQGESNSGNVTPADNDDKSDVHLCIICNRGFINLQHLKNHMMVTHSELRPYVCEYCDAGFTKAQALKTHLQSHAQERPYVCGMCGETFAESKALRSHSNSKHKNAEVDDVKSERKTPDSTEKGSLDITDDVPYASNVSDNEDSRDGNQITHSIKQENDGKLRETDNVELSQFVVIESPQADTLDSESDFEHSKNTEKTSGEDEVGGSNEDSTVALMSTESMNNSQKMVGNIRIELNSEFQGADYDDLDDRLKNDPVFANVGENEEDKQSSFSGHSSNDEFDQSDDTQNDHEFRDAMFP